MANKLKTTDKKESNWALLQIRKETHEMLKAHCELHGFKMSALASNIIKEYIKKHIQSN
jgi:hypothetical protein